MTNYAFCRCNEWPSIRERVHPFFCLPLLLLFFLLRLPQPLAPPRLSLVFLFLFLPFLVSLAMSLLSRCVHTRGLHQTCLSLGREGDVMALSGRPRRRSAACTISPRIGLPPPSLIYGIPHGYLVLKKDPSSPRRSLPPPPASPNLSDLPRFLMPSPTGIRSSS